MRKNLIMAALMATAAAAEGGKTTGAGGAAGTAPDSNVAEAAKPKRAPKNPDNLLDIINGRLPLAFVYLIRFKETGTTAERAKKYGTSVGKVFDIVKNRNFGYLTDAYKPSTDEVAAAKAWLEMKTAKGKTLKEAGGDPEGILTALNGLGVATAEEVAARNWQTRTVGQAAGTAPVAGAAAAPAAPAADKAGKPAAKVF
jgi:hypothetical protein